MSSEPPLTFEEFEKQIQSRKERKEREKYLKKKEKKKKRKEKKRLEKEQKQEKEQQQPQQSAYKIIDMRLKLDQNPKIEENVKNVENLSHHDEDSSQPSNYSHVLTDKFDLNNDNSHENEITRDEWMLRPPEQNTGKFQKSKTVLSTPLVVSSRELNPLLNKDSKFAKENENEKEEDAPKSYTVGDGGKSWRESIEKAKKKRKLDDSETPSYSNTRQYFEDEQDYKRAKKEAAFKISQMKSSIQCYYCFDSYKMPVHLKLSLGDYNYLCLPDRGNLVPFHLYIIPYDHVSSITQMDDEVWYEVVQYMSTLTLFFKKEFNQSCLFIENVYHLSPKRHTYIECIPIKEDLLKQARIFFRKAISEEGSEWAQHKKVYEFEVVSGGVRKTIPRNFEYFMVQFGMKDGLAHVIENKKSFSKIFGREVIAGLLRLPVEKYKFGQIARPEEEVKQEAKDFLNLWIKYDWTLRRE